VHRPDILQPSTGERRWRVPPAGLDRPAGISRRPFPTGLLDRGVDAVGELHVEGGHRVHQARSHNKHGHAFVGASDVRPAPGFALQIRQPPQHSFQAPHQVRLQPGAPGSTPTLDLRSGAGVDLLDAASWTAATSRERVWFANQGCKGCGDLLDAGADVGRGGAGIATAVGVPGVRAGHGVAEVAFHPGQCGVAQPVGAPPFSRSKRRHWSGSMSAGRNANAPPRRQAVSVCNRSNRLSNPGSLPVPATTSLISASRPSGTARRVLASRRGFATFRAGLFDVRRARLVEPLTPVLEETIPVRAVHPAGSRTDRLRDARNVLGGRRRGRLPFQESTAKTPTQRTLRVSSKRQSRERPRAALRMGRRSLGAPSESCRPDARQNPERAHHRDGHTGRRHGGPRVRGRRAPPRVNRQPHRERTRPPRTDQRPTPPSPPQRPTPRATGWRTRCASGPAGQPIRPTHGHRPARHWIRSPAPPAHQRS
jgi:hypothetical protein